MYHRSIWRIVSDFLKPGKSKGVIFQSQLLSCQGDPAKLFKFESSKSQASYYFWQQGLQLWAWLGVWSWVPLSREIINPQKNHHVLIETHSCHLLDFEQKPEPECLCVSFTLPKDGGDTARWSLRTIYSFMQEMFSTICVLHMYLILRNEMPITQV